MSKHQRHVRRERKKTDRARQTRALSSRHPTSRIKHGVAALAAAAAIAAGTSAYASPVRFDNPAHADPGHFHWTPADIDIFLNEPNAWLDVTKAPGDQGGGSGYSSVGQLFRGSLIGYYPNYTYDGAALARRAQPAYANYYLTTGDYGAGDTIDGSLGFTAIGVGSYSDHIFGADLFGFPVTFFAEGLPRYMAVKLNDGGGDHYGWLGVVRTGFEFEAFAWGYETEVGVPLAAGVPEPGTLALLAVGAVGLAGRRSRRQRHDN